MDFMNVIAGKYKGQKIKALPGLTTRPTSARTKEDIFNILSNYFIYENKISFDPFGGTGALSLEGLSRGIKKAYINDNNLAVVKIMQDNFRKIPLTDFEIWKVDYLVALNRLKQLNQKIDLIYLDPPFTNVNAYDVVLDFISKNKLLNLWGCVIIESAHSLDLAMIKTKFKLNLLKSKQLKTKNFYILRNEEKN